MSRISSCDIETLINQHFHIHDNLELLNPKLSDLKIQGDLGDTLLITAVTNQATQLIDRIINLIKNESDREIYLLHENRFGISGIRAALLLDDLHTLEKLFSLLSENTIAKLFQAEHELPMRFAPHFYKFHEHAHKTPDRIKSNIREKNLCEIVLEKSSKELIQLILSKLPIEHPLIATFTRPLQEMEQQARNTINQNELVVFETQHLNFLATQETKERNALLKQCTTEKVETNLLHASRFWQAATKQSEELSEPFTP